MKTIFFKYMNTDFNPMLFYVECFLWTKYKHNINFKDERNNFSMSIGEHRTNTELLVKRHLYQVENHCVIMNQKHRLLYLCLYIYSPFSYVVYFFMLNLFLKMDIKNLLHVNAIRRMKNKQTSQWLKEEF